MTHLKIDPHTIESIKKISDAAIHPTTKNKIRSVLTGVALSVTCLCSANMIHPDDSYVPNKIRISPIPVEKTNSEKLFEDQEAKYKMAMWVHNKYGTPTQMSYEIIQSVSEASMLLGQDPFLILAIIDVESNFNPNAISHKNAQGIIQINTTVHGSIDGLSIQKQVETGIGILLDAQYRYKTNDVVELLQRYNGNIKDRTTSYANKVLAMKEIFEDLIVNDLNSENQHDIISQAESFPLYEETVTSMSHI